MSKPYNSILAPVAGVFFAKWINGICPSKEPSKYEIYTLHVKPEVNLALLRTKKNVSEPFNDRFFLSSGTYYLVISIILYALLRLTYLFWFAADTYLNRCLQHIALKLEIYLAELSEISTNTSTYLAAH